MDHHAHAVRPGKPRPLHSIASSESCRMRKRSLRAPAQPAKSTEVFAQNFLPSSILSKLPKPQHVPQQRERQAPFASLSKKAGTVAIVNGLKYDVKPSLLY